MTEAVVKQPELGKGARVLMLAAAAGALGACIWALTREACAQCGGLHAYGIGWNLGTIGTVFYTSLLAALFFGARSPYVRGAFILAAGVHAALLGQMLVRQDICPPCITAGTAALLGAVVAASVDRAFLFRSGMVLAAGFILANYGTMVLRDAEQKEWDQNATAAAVQILDQKNDVPKGKAGIITFVRMECKSCTEYLSEVLNPLQQELGDQLLVDNREAPSSLPVPTVLVIGVRNTLFTHKPTKEELRTAIGLASGEKDLDAHQRPGIPMDTR
jgi:hypothetical protein